MTEVAFFQHEQFGNADLDGAAILVSRWAEQKAKIRKVWFFGSRVRGSFVQSSDLDIAVELEFEENGTAFAYWALDSSGWEAELVEILPWRIDLQLYVREEAPVIETAIRSSSKLIFERC